MPKTPKNESAIEENATGANATPAAGQSTTAASKKRAKSTKTPAAKRTGAKKKPSPVGSTKKKSASKRRSNPVEAADPSDADIRLRAYFIAERRVQLALQGDPARDWIEARQQLIEEARQAQS